MSIPKFLSLFWVNKPKKNGCADGLARRDGEVEFHGDQNDETAEMSGRDPGRPSTDPKQRRLAEKEERRNDVDRIEVERFFNGSVGGPSIHFVEIPDDAA